MSELELFLNIKARDPVIARDGRPFGEGMRMKSLDWPYPSVVAGSLRTLLGNLSGGFRGLSEEEYRELTKDLKSISIAGPFPCTWESTGHSELWFPRPLDLAVKKDASGRLQICTARPWDNEMEGGGCDLPPGLYPVMLSDDVIDEFKPTLPPGFWSSSRMAQWLASSHGDGFLSEGTTTWGQDFLELPIKDTRTHVQMDSGRGAGKEGALFRTVGIDMERLKHRIGTTGASPCTLKDCTEIVLALKLRPPARFYGLIKPEGHLSPLGGERRLVHWKPAPTDSEMTWSCPKVVQDALTSLDSESRKFVRMILATPALFKAGWLPGWLHGQGARSEPTGTIPGTDVKVRLIGATFDRWRPISGWSYEPPVGPKPVRRMVPAGGVYFFEVLEGKPSQLANHWLYPVSDCAEGGDGGLQACRDGFGLAFWGIWKPHKEHHKLGGK